MSDLGTSSDTPNEESTDVQISPAHLALASKLAHKKGLDVEIYLQTLVHDELTRNAEPS